MSVSHIPPPTPNNTERCGLYSGLVVLEFLESLHIQHAIRSPVKFAIKYDLNVPLALQVLAGYETYAPVIPDASLIVDVVCTTDEILNSIFLEDLATLSLLEKVGHLNALLARFLPKSIPLKTAKGDLQRWERFLHETNHKVLSDSQAFELSKVVRFAYISFRDVFM